MQVIVHEAKTVEIHDLTICTLKQFIDINHSLEAFIWCGGYLLSYAHCEGKEFDKGILGGTWRYNGVDVASLPYFQMDIQTRYAKKPIFDNTGNHISESIIKYVKRHNTE